jgi:hypothetical protein
MTLLTRGGVEFALVLDIDVWKRSVYVRAHSLTPIGRAKDAYDRYGVHLALAERRPAVVKLRAVDRRDKVDGAQAEADETVIERDGLRTRRRVGAAGGSDCSIADVGEQMQSRRRLLTRERLTHEPERRALNRRLRCSSRKPLESWKSSSREGTKSDLSRETSQMSTTRSEVFQASAEYSKHADDVHSRDSTYNNRIWRLTGSKLWRGAS